MNNRNIAVFFSGRLTEKYFVKDNLEKLRERYNPIIFCSLNENADSKEFIDKFVKEFNIKDECINIERCIMPEEMFKSIKNLNGSYNNVYSMYYNNKKNYELIKNYEKMHNIKFDVILRYRTEIWSNDVIDIIENLKKNTVYIPNKYDWCGGLNDQVAYGDSESMEKYCECVDNIVNLCNQGVIYHPETLLLHHVKSKNLSIERINFEYRLR